MQPRLEIEGIRELNKILRAAGGRPLQKELGALHKEIGGMVIQAAGGKATGVGLGAGSTIRTSAVTREVVLRVGGKHRMVQASGGRKRGKKRLSPKDLIRVQQWGARPVRPHPERPGLIQSAIKIQKRIEDVYIDGVERIMRRAGAKG